MATMRFLEAENKGMVVDGRETRFKWVEVEDNDYIVRLEGYYEFFREMTVLDKRASTLGTYFVPNGMPVSPSAVVPFRTAMKAIHGLLSEARITQQIADVIHTPGEEEKPKVDDPRTTVYVEEIPVYPFTLGSHRPHKWHHKRWDVARNHPDEMVRLLAAMNARVFPCYVRKRYRNRKPGDFIGLGEPDAHVFKDCPAAVRFIREHTDIRLVFPKKRRCKV